MLPLIDSQNIFSFTIRIIRTLDAFILIGVIDSSRKNDKKSVMMASAADYEGITGRIYPEWVQQGYGFKQGDIVETVVDLGRKKIKWIVNGYLQAVSKGPTTEGPTFVPYIEMYDNEDSVEWLGCKCL